MLDAGDDMLKFFWGKAQSGDGKKPGEPDYHPLVAHMLDVAAVAVLLPGNVHTGLDRRQLGLLVALHDIGKIMPAFQAKVPACWPHQALGPYADAVTLSRHDVDGLLLLDYVCEDVLAPLFGVDDNGFDWSPVDKRQIWRAIAGHHGQPVAVTGNRARGLQKAVCGVYARQFCTLLFDIFRPPPIPCLSPQDLLRLEWRLAGLTVTADWIGSRREWFPYVAPDAVEDAAGYFWNHALPHARTAIARAGLGPVDVAPFRGIGRLFPRISIPSPVQALMEGIDIPEGPTLVVIEDMTGAGKTEAAMVAAHRLMASGHANGLFVALPTMATANAMFDRLASAYRGLFQPSSHPSLALAHGRARLDERFVSVVAPDDHVDGMSVQAERTDAAEICCSAWLGSEARRALLAQVGVGTIDQAFMAVLPVRFATIRQAGLAGKILLVDECHAYDPYMHEEMAALLRFHAAMGGSAILLSATLTQSVRHKLTMAFREGLHHEGGEALSSTAYPLVTLVARAGVEELPCAPRPGLRRDIAVRCLEDGQAVMVAASNAARQGAAVAWVRNTVDDVIATAKLMAQEGTAVTVFHARFAMVDRLAIERDVLARFGRDGDDTVRAGVLVASQVIEQSLDLDFDVLFTDLAPMDLIIQRAGRLRRHERHGRPVDREEVWVLSPEPVDDPDPQWLARLLPGTAAVYRDPALLWRTARVLQRVGRICTPDNIRALIEEAGDDRMVPPGLMAASDEARGKGWAARGAASRNVLNYATGYAPDGALWERDVSTPTRLEERPYVTVRLAVIRDGQVLPWAVLKDSSLAPPEVLRRAWALSEISVARHSLAACAVPAVWAGAVMTARAAWSRWEREDETQFLLLLLDEGEDGMEGRGYDEKGKEIVIRYDQQYGLQMLPVS